MKTVVLIVSLFLSATGIPQQKPAKPSDAAIAKWRALKPAVENVLKELNLHCDYPGGAWELAIVDAADFSSTDHMSAALVDWCNGGAYSDAILAVNLHEGKPVLSRFLSANNQEQTMAFLSGGSAMHSLGVKLVPEKNAISYIRIRRDDVEKGRHIVRVEQTPVPPIIGMLLGEFLYCLRSGLNQAAWHLALPDARQKTPRKIQFPIVESSTVQGFAATLKLFPRCRCQRNRIASAVSRNWFAARSSPLAVEFSKQFRQAQVDPGRLYQFPHFHACQSCCRAGGFRICN